MTEKIGTRRALAFLLDIIIITYLFKFVMIDYIYIFMMNNSGLSNETFSLVFLFVQWFVMVIFFENSPLKASPGKAIMGLKISDAPFHKIILKNLLIFPLLIFSILTKFSKKLGVGLHYYLTNINIEYTGDKNIKIRRITAIIMITGFTLLFLLPLLSVILAKMAGA